MDGTVDTAAAQQALVGGVDDGIHGQGRDVAQPGINLRYRVAAHIIPVIS
jgi:hypothetical protein